MEKSFAEQLREKAQAVQEQQAYKEREQAEISRRAFEITLEENAKAYVEYAKAKAEAAAEEGYGSIEMTLDTTYDQSGLDEGFAYESRRVEELLLDEGLAFYEITDHYDAVTYELIWNSDLPKSPDKIK